MTIDLYTDASIVKGRGAWACVILRDGEQVEHSGPLRGSFRSSAATEIAAIANGLHHGFKVGAIRHGDEVAAWCDNTAAMIWANGQARRMGKAGADPQLLDCRRWIRDFTRGRRIAFVARHVKGHQRRDSDDPRAIYNIRCDHLCSAVRDGIAAKPWSEHLRLFEVARARKARKAA